MNENGLFAKSKTFIHNIHLTKSRNYFEKKNFEKNSPSKKKHRTCPPATHHFPPCNFTTLNILRPSIFFFTSRTTFLHKKLGKNKFPIEIWLKFIKQIYFPLPDIFGKIKQSNRKSLCFYLFHCLHDVFVMRRIWENNWRCTWNSKSWSKVSWKRRKSHG